MTAVRVEASGELGARDERGGVPTRAATDAALAATVKADILVVKSNRQPLSMKVWRVTRERVGKTDHQCPRRGGSEKEATRIDW